VTPCCISAPVVLLIWKMPGPLTISYCNAVPSGSLPVMKIS
jgi:hypothetical protein